MYTCHLSHSDKSKMYKVASSEILESEEFGFLNINVYRHLLRLPIPAAIIRISKLKISGTYREQGSGFYIETKLSESDGSVQTFVLPILKDENEMYVVSIQANGFHIAYIFDIPIYPNITTTYDVYLRHFTFTGEPDYSFILQPQIPGRQMGPGIF